MYIVNVLFYTLFYFVIIWTELKSTYPSCFEFRKICAIYIQKKIVRLMPFLKTVLTKELFSLNHSMNICVWNCKYASTRNKESYCFLVMIWSTFVASVVNWESLQTINLPFLCCKLHRNPADINFFFY